MIGYIKGTITALSERECFVETSGIGYRVHVTDRDHDSLAIGDESKLYIHMAVREDAITLYGFIARETYELFLSLISVSKIGPKVALSILSVMKPSIFAMAIQNKDIDVLTKIPGIGKKTAERMLVELKDKIKGIGVEVSANKISVDTSYTGIQAEAMAALQSLGYASIEVADIVRRVNQEYSDVTDPGKFISLVLRELGKEKK